MENIEHTVISTNGINMHVASIGTGSDSVLFLHGFPELWYSWRHHLLSFSDLGYRAIAPDLRGYGDTDAPPSPDSYTLFHIVGDLIGLLDHFCIDRVFLVGHDWGAFIAWAFALFRPDRIKALVALSVPFPPRNPARNPVEILRDLFGDDYYVCRFQEPGEMEEDFGSMDTEDIFKIFLSIRDPAPPIIPKAVGMRGYPVPESLPSWLSQESLSYYATKFGKKGFTGGFNYFRALPLNWELTAPWSGSNVEVPSKFITGELDITYNIPGVKEYIHDGEFEADVLGLEEIVVIEGAAHFVNQENAEEVTKQIHEFILKF